MQIDVSNNIEKSEATVRVVVTREELEPYLKKAAAGLSKGTPLKGFRPGKAPVEVVEETFGKERLLNETAERAVPKMFVQAVMDEEIDAISRPSITIEELSLDGGMTFTAVVSVLPEVTLGSFDSLKMTKKSIEVKDEEVEKELTHLAKMRSKYLDVARPAEMGDTVTVDFKIDMNGEPMEGGESKNHPINLGEGHFVPDFEKNLVGIQAGDTREFGIDFPDDFARKELQGKKAEAKVTAHAVQKRVIPEINDEFVKELGSFKNLNDLKSKLKDNLGQERKQREEERRRGELAEQLAEAATFSHIPDALIDKEIDRRMGELNQMLEVQRKTLEEYLAAQKKSPEELREELKGPALKSVKVGLALRQLAVDQDVTVDEAKVDEKVNDYLKQYASKDDAAKKVDLEELRENVTNMLRNQMTMEKLEELAK